MSKPVCTLPFEYVDTPERRAVSLEPDGIACVPVLGYSHFTSSKPCVSEHTHPGCLEVTLCLRGSLIFECGGEERHLLPGTAAVTQPDERHRLSTNPKGLVTYWLFFRLEPSKPALLHLPSAESEALRAALRSLPRPLFKATEQLRLAFQRLFHLYDCAPKGPFRSLAMRGATLDLLLALIEAARTPPAPSGGARLRALVDAMRRHPEKPYTIDAMARQTALSPSQLITRFKAVTGFPPYTFLLNCRVRAAQARLRETVLPITRIAQELGFSSSQHLAMQFKREFGISPSELRSGRQPVLRSPKREVL
jgi:AraC-like DNA-binding protein